MSAPVLMSLAAALSAEVNTLQNLSGAEKKQLVCDIVTQALQTALTASKVGLGSPAVALEEEVALTYVAKNVIPASVDLLVAAANGQLNLKAVAKKGWLDCMSYVPVVEKKLRGPAWDVAEKFVKTAEASVAAGASVKDVVAAAVVVVEGAAVAQAEVAAVPTPVEAAAPAPALATTTPSS